MQIAKNISLQICIVFMLNHSMYLLVFQFQPLYNHSVLEKFQVWLGKTLQKLDSLLLGVCKDFKEESYLTVSALVS